MRGDGEMVSVENLLETTTSLLPPCQPEATVPLPQPSLACPTPIPVQLTGYTSIIDMTRAYQDATLTHLERTLTVNQGMLTLQDDFVFTRKPRSLVEAFVTFEKAVVSKDGASVQIGTRFNGLRIKANSEGTFACNRLVEESKEGPSGEIITRITFETRSLIRKMRLRFLIG